MHIMHITDTTINPIFKKKYFFNAPSNLQQKAESKYA